MSDVITVFLIVGSIIGIGFFANILFRKTRLPDIIFLIVIGMILGPILRIFPRESLLPIAPYLTNLTLLMILFDGGLNMNLQKVFSQSVRATLLALSYMIFGLVGITSLAHYLLELNWFQALILAPMLIGTSSVAIIPLVSRLSIPKEVGITLSLESAITDIINVVIVVTFLGMYSKGLLNIQKAASDIISEFAIGIVFGTLFGIVSIKLFYMARKVEYTYLFMIALLLLCYSLAESVGGSGAIASLFFGLILGNSGEITKIIRMRIRGRAMSYVKRIIRHFHGELSFLMRTFFFVFLGLIYDPTGISIGVLGGLPSHPLIVSILYSLSFVGLNLFTRYLAVRISMIKSHMEAYGKFMSLMCGQGLANATLSIMAFNELTKMGAFVIAPVYPIIVTNVIIFTNIITSLASFLLKKL